MGKCPTDGATLIDRPVAAEYALHLALTKGFDIRPSYLHCPHCGENFGTKASEEALKEQVARLEAELKALKEAQEAKAKK